MYLEGSDQHRGWFQSSLLLGTGAYRSRAVRKRSCAAASPWTRTARRCPSPRATASIPPRSPASSAPTCCACGSPPPTTRVDVSIGDDDPAAHFRRVPTLPQHVPLPARQPVRLRLREATPSPSADMPPVDVWALLRLRQVLADVEKGLRRVPLPSGVPRAVRVRRERPVRHLHGCREGSPVLRGA